MDETKKNDGNDEAELRQHVAHCRTMAEAASNEVDRAAWYALANRWQEQIPNPPSSWNDSDER
jgi:hypothetical protein